MKQKKQMLYCSRCERKRKISVETSVDGSRIARCSHCGYIILNTLVYEEQAKFYYEVLKIEPELGMS